MRSIEARIQELEDLEAIRQLKYQYAKKVDDHDVATFGDLFTADAVWDGGERLGLHEGRDAIHAFLTKTWDNLWSIHHMTNPEITVDQSALTAVGSWLTWSPNTISGRAIWVSGRYDDEYKKEDGRWLIARSRFTFDFMTPFESGWVKERFAEEALDFAHELEA
jgi:uncharacterized protein (TIGR02246 family)